MVLEFGRHVPSLDMHCRPLWLPNGQNILWLLTLLYSSRGVLLGLGFLCHSITTGADLEGGFRGLQPPQSPGDPP